MVNVVKIGKCALCDAFGKLHVDHCHNSGGVRGLVCARCNSQALPSAERFKSKEELMAYMARVCAYLGIT
jgi:hypothetical protein